MSFTGFPSAAFEFFEGLAAENSKPYWEAHRAVYESSVRAPLQALTDELEPEFGPAKIFRIYRDVRFSKDKTPYKTQQGAHTSQGYYLAVDADGLMVAGGVYRPSSGQLARFRSAVNEDLSGKVLAAIVENLVAAGFEIAGDRMKTRPRGFTEDHPRIELLRHRSLYAHHGWPADPWMSTREVVDRVRAAWHSLAPLVQWGDDHLGPAD